MPTTHPEFALATLGKAVGIAKLAPHDLATDLRSAVPRIGSELEQIQFLLGHVSAQANERYLGCKQRIRSAVNDRIAIEPNPNLDGLQHLWSPAW